MALWPSTERRNRKIRAIAGKAIQKNGRSAKAVLHRGLWKCFVGSGLLLPMGIGVVEFRQRGSVAHPRPWVQSHFPSARNKEGEEKTYRPQSSPRWRVAEFGMPSQPAQSSYTSLRNFHFIFNLLTIGLDPSTTCPLDASIQTYVGYTFPRSRRDYALSPVSRDVHPRRRLVDGRETLP
ncbi:hypothetical protein J2X72_002884 [Phyllobacterium sp. 1468]|nr:hypothetical protein [Phyllobacterium sp. 1468]